MWPLRSPRRRGFGQTDGGRDAANKPPGTNQQIHWVLEEGRTVPLDGVANELKHPPNPKQQESPTPVKEK